MINYNLEGCTFTGVQGGGSPRIQNKIQNNNKIRMKKGQGLILVLFKPCCCYVLIVLIVFGPFSVNKNNNLHNKKKHF